MTTVLHREWFDVKRADTFKILPIGDMHLGSVACDEKLLAAVCKRIKNERNTYWIGMGDYCLPIDSKILTRTGWRGYDEVVLGEEVAAYTDGHLCWAPLSGVYISIEQPLLRLHSKSFSMICTPGHSWMVTDTHGIRQARAKRVRRHTEYPRKIQTRDLKTHHRIIVAAPMVDEDGFIPLTDEEAEIIGWLVCDGHVKTKPDLCATITQEKEPYRTQIRQKYGHWFTAEYQNGTFHLKTKKVRDLLNALRIAPENIKQELPSLVGRMSTSSRMAMMTAMLEAEGWQERGKWRFSQKPGPILDTFRILATLAGIRLGYKGINKAGVVTLTLRDDSRPQVAVADLTITGAGNGPAWCPQTEFGNWVTLQGNQVTITGNCDFINRSDKRFDERELAPWAQGKADICAVQIEHLLDYLRPIASKCLGLLTGNHEEAILLTYERDIMTPIISEIREQAQLPDTHKLRLDYYGWMRLNFYRAQDRHASTRVILNLHHGMGGGRMKGGKALNLQRWLWTHEADIVLFGHTHDELMQIDAVERLDDSDNIITDHRRGVYTGTFMRNAGYAIRKGYLPLPIGGSEIWLRPGAADVNDRIRILT